MNVCPGEEGTGVRETKGLFFNKLQLMVPQQQWRAKAVFEALKETRIEVAEEKGVADAEVPVETEVNWSDQPTTPVRPVDGGSTQDWSDRSDTPVRSFTEVST
jgi:hypothetical protein